MINNTPDPVLSKSKKESRHGKNHHYYEKKGAGDEMKV